MLDLSKFEGKPLPWECQTRDGRRAEIVYISRDGSVRQLLAVISGSQSAWHYKDGRFLADFTSKEDLINIPEEIRPKAEQVWQLDRMNCKMQVYFAHSGHALTSAGTYNTQYAIKKSFNYGEEIIHGQNGWKRVYPPVNEEG